MQTMYKLIAGSLAGAVAIHVAFVACGRGLSVKGNADAGTEASLVDALVDHISGLLDGTTKDARADVDGGPCGCTVSGPMQSIPASENPAQLARGNLSGLTGTGAIVVTGPFVLTDATSVPEQVGTVGGAALVLQPAAAACAAPPGAADTSPGYVTSVLATSQMMNVVHGGRYVVPAGQMLCAFNPDPGPQFSGELQWAGFAPYP